MFILPSKEQSSMTSQHLKIYPSSSSSSSWKNPRHPLITNFDGSGNCSHSHSHSSIAHSRSLQHCQFKYLISTALHSFFSFSFSFIFFLFRFQLQRPHTKTRFPRRLGFSKRRCCPHPPNLCRLRLPLRRPHQPRPLRHRPRRQRRQVPLFFIFLDY